jgi:hypothetical protein
LIFLSISFEVLAGPGACRASLQKIAERRYKDDIKNQDKQHMDHLQQPHPVQDHSKADHNNQDEAGEIVKL